jgi:hypothetical protein
MGFICGRQLPAAMLRAERKERIVVEFSETGSTGIKPGMLHGSYWHKVHITSAGR